MRVIQDTEILLKFGLKIKKWRLENSMTQVELSKACGFNPTYIRLVEQGKINISFLKLIRLTQIMGLDPEDLVGEL